MPVLASATDTQTENGTYTVSFTCPAGYRFTGGPSLWHPSGDGQVTLNQVHYFQHDAQQVGEGEYHGWTNQIIITYTIDGGTTGPFVTVVSAWVDKIPCDEDYEHAVNLIT